MVTTTRSLRTGAWEADVRAVESAVGRFTRDRRLQNACQVSFFEVAGDARLHVNVKHRYETTAPRGWAGPARLSDGFVHNRRFGATHDPHHVIRQIRNMVFAERA